MTIRSMYPILTASVMFFPVTVAFIANLPLSGFDLVLYLGFEVPLGVGLVRSLFVRVRIVDDNLFIHSWLRRYTIALSDILRVDSVGYRGLLNEFTSWRFDPLYRFTGMLQVRRANESARTYPSTIHTRRGGLITARRIAEARDAALTRSSEHVISESGLTGGEEQ